MSISVTDDHMITAVGLASATRGKDQLWGVSYMPTNERFDRNEAITALLAADHVLSVVEGRPREITSRGEWFGHHCDDTCPFWPFIGSWAIELAYSANSLVDLIHKAVRTGTPN